MNVAVAVVMLFSQLAPYDARAVVARPEVSNANVVHLGQILVIPLYDGKLAPRWHGSAEGLRYVGERRIRKHELLRDLGSRPAFGYAASSKRGAAFVVEQSGGGSINVLLRLPQLKERCASCRTVHFFYRAV